MRNDDQWLQEFVAKKDIEPEEETAPVSEEEAFSFLEQYKELAQRAAAAQNRWQAQTVAIMSGGRLLPEDEAMAILNENRSIKEQQATLRALWAGFVEGTSSRERGVIVDWAGDPAVEGYYQNRPAPQSMKRQSKGRDHKKQAWENLRRKVTGRATAQKAISPSPTIHVLRSDAMKDESQTDATIPADTALAAQATSQEQPMDWGMPPANNAQIAAEEKARFEKAKEVALGDPEQAKQTKSGQFALAQATAAISKSDLDKAWRITETVASFELEKTALTQSVANEWAAEHVRLILGIKDPGCLQDALAANGHLMKLDPLYQEEFNRMSPELGVHSARALEVALPTSVDNAEVMPAAGTAIENTIEMVAVWERTPEEEAAAHHSHLLDEIRHNTYAAMVAPPNHFTSHEAASMVQDDLQLLGGIHDREQRERALQLMSESCFAQEAYASKFIDLASPQVQDEMAAATKKRDAELAASEALDQSLKQDAHADAATAKEAGPVAAPAVGAPLQGIDADALARVAAARAKDRQEVAKQMGMNTIERSEAQQVTPPATVDLAKPAAASVAPLPSKQVATPDPALTVIPPEVEGVFLKVDNKFYHPKNQKRVAFEDHGKTLHTALSEAPVVLAMVQIAEARGWKEIKVSGTPEFRKEAWRAAALRGIAVQGYKPTELDLADLERRIPKAKATNQVAATPLAQQPGIYISADDAAILAAAKAAWGQTLQPATVPVPALAAARASSPPQPTAKATSEAADATLKGELLVSHGAAPYKHNKNNPISHFVVLANDQGKERTVWGVKLGEAIEKAGVHPGDQVILAKNGEEHVVVDANVKDEHGRVVAKQKIGATRNEWEVKAVAFASQPAEQVAQAHPDLAGALAIPVAIGLQARADGYNAAQAAYIEARAREIAAQTIASGRAPELKRRETVEVQQQPQQELAQ